MAVNCEVGNEKKMYHNQLFPCQSLHTGFAQKQTLVLAANLISCHLNTVTLPY